MSKFADILYYLEKEEEKLKLREKSIKKHNKVKNKNKIDKKNNKTKSTSKFLL